MGAALELLTNLGQIAWLEAAGLVFARLLPIVAFTPIFGGPSTPARFRTGLAILLTIVLTPVVVTVPAESLAGIDWAGLLAKEALVGLTIAIWVRILFEVLASCGAVIDVTRGATIANVFDPVTRAQTSVLSAFFLQFAVVVFLTAGGHRIFLAALGQSFVAVPAAEPLPAALLGGATTGAILTLFGEMLVIALQLAAPVVAVMLILDIVLGLLNRVAPQVQVFFLSMTVKATLGIWILFLTIGLVFEKALATIVDRLAAWPG